MRLFLSDLRRYQAGPGKAVHLANGLFGAVWCGLGMETTWLRVGGPATDARLCKRCLSSAKSWGYK